MSKVCCVCGEAKESKDNVLFNCKGHGCDVTVHQGIDVFQTKKLLHCYSVKRGQEKSCYGIVSMPTGLWFCRKCESQERAARVRCELCPKKEGALKHTDGGGWAHVVCALYIPEVTFGNNRVMEPIVTSKLPRERFSKSCYICEEKGKEMQSTYGACMSCHKSSCRLAFHVTCAQRERLLCEEQDTRDARNIIYCGYCNSHHKKMMRQKLKQHSKPPGVAGTSGPIPTTPSSPSTGCTTPLSAIPDLSQLEGGVAREAGHLLEQTSSVSPGKMMTKMQKERLSLSEAPSHKRLLPQSSSSSLTSEVAVLTGSTSSSSSSSKSKQRRRKPSSSNESSTSEAPSNTSDVPLPPPNSSSSSSSSLANHLIPISPVPLPSRATHKSQQPNQSPAVEGVAVKVEKAEGEDQEEVLQRMLQVGTDQFSVPSTTSDASCVVSGLAKRRITSTSTSSEQGSKIQAPPPRSLQELLERQWEQTAQFILDQAGKQNNAGSMLAHLHTLQTENRQMQSRIMELASQREFYSAINTKLRQTLSEHDLGRPNGVQLVADGVQRQLLPTTNSTQEPMEVNDLPHVPPQDHAHHPPGNHHREPHPPTPPSPRLSNTLPPEDQESLLHAHFSSSSVPPSATIGSGTHPSRGDHSFNHGNEVSSQQHHGHSQQEVMGGTGNPAHASNFLSTFTQLPPQVTSQGLPSMGHTSSPMEATPSLSSSHVPTSPLVDYANRVPQVLMGDASIHEVTQVTRSIQAPISSFTPLPSEMGVADHTGGVTM